MTATAQELRAGRGRAIVPAPWPIEPSHGHPQCDPPIPKEPRS